MTFVLIGIAVLVVGGIVYFVTKKGDEDERPIRLDTVKRDEVVVEKPAPVPATPSPPPAGGGTEPAIPPVPTPTGAGDARPSLPPLPTSAHDPAFWKIDPASGDFDARPTFVPTKGWGIMLAVTGVKREDGSPASGAPFYFGPVGLPHARIVSGHKTKMPAVPDHEIPGRMIENADRYVLPALTLTPLPGFAPYGTNLNDKGEWRGVLSKSDGSDEHLTVILTATIGGRVMAGSEWVASCYFRTLGWFEANEQEGPDNDPSDYLRLAVPVDN